MHENDHLRAVLAKRLWRHRRCDWDLALSELAPLVSSVKASLTRNGSPRCLKLAGTIALSKALSKVNKVRAASASLKSCFDPASQIFIGLRRYVVISITKLILF